MHEPQWDCSDMPGDNIECRGAFTLGTACGVCSRCRRVLANGISPYPYDPNEALNQRKRAEEAESRINELLIALNQIAELEWNRSKNDGTCNCPHIAQEAILNDIAAKNRGRNED